PVDTLVYSYIIADDLSTNIYEIICKKLWEMERDMLYKKEKAVLKK
ncbi:nucleotide pyrophosphohydrolase, partial [Staphylococcus simulans]